MKKPDDLETRILQVLDDNIRLIQYSVYAVGLIGLAVVAKSTHAVSRLLSQYIFWYFSLRKFPIFPSVQEIRLFQRYP